MHRFWKERYDFESTSLDDVINLREVRIYSVNIPEWEAHDDAPAKICSSKSSKKITVHGGEFAPLRLNTLERDIARIHQLPEVSFADDMGKMLASWNLRILEGWGLGMVRDALNSSINLSRIKLEYLTLEV